LAKTVLAISSLALIFSLIALMFYLQPIQPTIDYTKVLHLKLNEGNGDIVHDSSEFENDGTIYDASWVNGKYGKALSFDGTDDCMDIAYSANLDILNNLTVTAWIKADDPWGGGDLPIVWHSGIQSAFGFDKATGKARADLYIGGAWRGPWLSANAVSSGVWHYMVYTYDGGRVKIYVDSINVVDQAQTGNLASSVSIRRIGKDTAGPAHYHMFKGIIDEVRIYNRVLSQSEIKDIYSSEYS